MVDFLGLGSGAAIGGIASGIGGIVGAGASTAAANAQTAAANRAIALQQSMFGTTQNNLIPFIAGGQNAILPYWNLLSDLNLPQALTGVTPPTPPLPTQTTFDLNSYQMAHGQAPFSAQPFTTPSGIPTWDSQSWGLGANQQNALENTPGYQFTLNQGLRGVANQEAAKGRGVSGNELAGAGAYTTGLANSTFNQQLQNQLQSQGQGFNQPLQLQNQAWNQLLQGQGQGYGQAYSNVNQQMALNKLAFDQQMQAFTGGLASQQLGLQGQGQGYTQAYQNALAPFGLWQPLINTGLQGAIGGGNIATNVGSNLTNLTTGAGAAQAGGIVGAGNALTGAGNNIANQLILNQLLNPSGGGVAQPNTQNTGLPF